MGGARLAVVALLVVGLLGGALLWLDFHASRSETRAESQVVTMSSGSQGQANGQISRADSLALHVAGDGGIESSLRRSLPAELDRLTAVGTVRELESPDVPVKSPALLVDLTSTDVMWTPVHATAAITVAFVYSSNGDLTWRDDESVVMSNENGAQVRIKGEIKLSDATSGVISRRAYERKLADALAAEVGTRLGNALSTPAGSPAGAEMPTTGESFAVRSN